MPNPGELVISVENGSNSTGRGHYPEELWESFKPVLKRLYLEEKKTLVEVRQVMLRDHGFKASHKMYKTRFRQWNWNKYITDKLARKMVTTKARRDAVGKQTKFLLHGKQVNLAGYLARKNISENALLGPDDDRLSSPDHRTPTPDPVSGLDQPDDLRFQEDLLVRLRTFFVNLQTTPREDAASPTADWLLVARGNGVQMAESIRHGTRYLAAGRPNLGFEYIRQAFSQVQKFLSRPEPFDLFNLLFAQAEWHEPIIAMTFWQHIDAMAAARSEYGHLRPTLTLIYEMVRKMGAAKVAGLLEQGRESLAEVLEDVYGSTHPQAISAWRMLTEHEGRPADDERTRRMLAVLPTTFADVDRHFGYGSAPSIQCRKWYFSLKQWLGLIGEDAAQDEINRWLADPDDDADPPVPLNHRQRITRDRTGALHRFHLARCAGGGPARDNPRHALARHHLQQSCDVLAVMCGEADPNLIWLLADLENLCIEAGDETQAQVLRWRREAGEALVLEKGRVARARSREGSVAEPEA